MATMNGKKGVDISYANGNINLTKVKNAGYEFVMIRCGYGSDITSQDDTQFASNVTKAEKLGMPWGVYLYSYATNTTEAKSEVEHIKRLLKGKKPTMPIALDVEDSSYYTKHGCYNKTALTSIVGTILKGIKDAGYYPMLYTGKYWLDTYIDKSVYGAYDLWIASWTNKCLYTGSNLGMWQYGGEINVIESNSISGVGVIDKDICYKDYPTIIKNGGYNGWVKSPNTGTNASTNAKTITEQQLRQKVCNIINSWLGAVEGDDTHAEILRIYNNQNPLPVGYKMKLHDAWCAATVSAAWLKAGIAKYTGTECGCGRFIDDAKKRGIWVEADGYKPKLADAVIYDWDDSGVGECTTGADHIGLVTEVNGNSFKVTEGNTGNGALGKVGERTMKVNGKYIRGFIAPDYSTIAKKVTGKVTADTNIISGTNTPKIPVPKIPNAIYKVRANGRWLPEVYNLTDYAGITGKPITDIAVKFSEGTCRYRVMVNGKWLPFVTGYNTSDYNNGYAGNGKIIEAVEIYYNTPDRIAKGLGYLKAKYRVSPLNRDYYPWQYDNEKTNGQDGYAGCRGIMIDRFQLTLSK